MSNRRPRRVIRGYRALKQYTDPSEITRAIIADDAHQRGMTGARAETSEWQRQRDAKVTHPDGMTAYPFIIRRVPPKKRAGQPAMVMRPPTNARGARIIAGMANIMKDEKRAFSIAAFCQRYGIGRTSVYEEIAAGRLKVVKAGKRTLVPADAAEAWLKNLPELSAKPQPPQT